MTPTTNAAARDHAPGEAAEQVPGPLVRTFIAARGDVRLDLFLTGALQGCSRAVVQRLIAAGMVGVEGSAVVRPAYRIAARSVVTVTLPDPRPSTLIPEEMAFDVLYEDSDLLVLNKPAGTVVHPAPGHSAHTLVHGLLARCTDLSGIGGEQRPGIVHRLDRDTSGLLMVAKNDRSHASLSRQLAERTVKKFYLALLCRTPVTASGIIDAPIARDPRDRLKMAIRDNGRAARTRYRVLGHASDQALVVAELETGRTHQLRVHFAALGCPIAGDSLYGTAGGLAGRLWLHAWRLGFTRPSDAERIVLEAPLPEQLARSWPAPNVQGAASRTRMDEPEPLEVLLTRARRWAADSAPAAPMQER